VEVDVFLAGWEIECCRPPPGEADQVEWPLLWSDDPAGPGAADIAWTVHSAHARMGTGPGGLLLAHGPLRAWWIGLSPDGVPARGCLVADLHGGLPDGVLTPAAGTVLSVRVVEQAYRYTHRGYAPIDGAYTLRPVARSPRWFTGRPRDEQPPAVVVRQESGVVVGLRIDPAQDMLPG
jgi:hypothetical protein